MAKRNLKVTTRVGAQPEKLTRAQIDELAEGLALDLAEEYATARSLMLLLHEIATHPFDHAHVEAIADTINAHLFMYSPTSEVAFKLMIAAERGRAVHLG